MPGNNPSLASSLKCTRQTSNFRIYPLLRPQIKHRLTNRVENFGFFFALAMVDSLAISASLNSKVKSNIVSLPADRQALGTSSKTFEFCYLNSVFINPPYS